MKDPIPLDEAPAELVSLVDDYKIPTESVSNTTETSNIAEVSYNQESQWDQVDQIASANELNPSFNSEPSSVDQLECEDGWGCVDDLDGNLLSVNENAWQVREAVQAQANNQAESKNKQLNEEIRVKIEKALINNSSMKYFFGKDFNILKVENDFIHYQDAMGEILLPGPNLLGDHQIYNISTSIAASRRIFNIKDEHIKKGITNIKLNGRLQEINSGKLKDIIGKNRLIIDGGHNESSGISISNWIKQQNQDVHLICGMMKDKEHNKFIQHFCNFTSKRTHFYDPHGSRLKY